MSFMFTFMFGILGIIMTLPQQCGGSAFGSIGILSKFWNFISLEKTLTFMFLLDYSIFQNRYNKCF